MESIKQRLISTLEGQDKPDRSAVMNRFSVWIEWGGEMMPLRELAPGERLEGEHPIVWIEHDGTLERRGFW